MPSSSGLKYKSLEILWNYIAATFMKLNCQGTAYIRNNCVTCDNNSLYITVLISTPVYSSL